MTTLEFLSELNALGIKLWLEGEQLRYRAPQGVMNQDLKKKLLGRKIEIIAFLQEAKNSIHSRLEPILPVERSLELPLSFAQQRMWFASQLESNLPYYNANFGLHLQGTLNVKALEQSINQIIRRHESLRTTFRAINGKPIQAIAANLAITIPLLDLQTCSDAEVQQIITKEVSQPFDLSTGPLLRVALLHLERESYMLILTMHHIITDGWSMGVFFQELSSFYRSFVEGNPVSLPELTIQYADFAVWQRQWLTGEVLETQLNYWKQQLADATPLLELPTDKPRPSVKTYQGTSQEFQVNVTLTEQLKTLSQKSGATLFHVLLAAYVLILYRYSGQDDINIGCAIANRNRRELEPLIGFFANTLVLRHQINGNTSFFEFLNQVRHVAMSAYTHQDVPFEQVVEACAPERSLSYNPLFQAMFVLENFSLDTLELPNITLNPQVVSSGTSAFDLNLLIWETKNGLVGWWEYSSDLFESDTITRMVSHFQTLLAAIVANPDQPISKLCLLTKIERDQLLFRGHRNYGEFLKNQCLHQLFEEQAQRSPDAVAVVWQEQKLTYQQLNEQANQLAHYLRKQGIGLEDLVGICLERSPLMIVALLGILKAGGAYLPIDSTDSSERSQLILAQTKPSMLLSQVHLVKHLPKHNVPVICLDSHWLEITQQSQENPNIKLTSDHLAYVLYSSFQKVLVEHCGVSQRLSWWEKTFALSESDVFLHQASLAQDTAVWEIFLPLVVGRRLIISCANNQDHLTKLQHLIVSQKISVINFVPSALSAFLTSLSEDEKAQLSSLRLVVCNGEPLQRYTVEVFKAHLKAELHNLYSLIEAGGEITSLACDSCSIQDNLLIGHPTYRSLYILDKHLQPVPMGVQGEIYIGGAGLARGYFQPIKNPFPQTADVYLYKTGDLGRWLRDGTLELLGNENRQIWIKGYCVKLPEIEAALLTFPAVEAARVLVREDATGLQLVAYIVSKGAFFPKQLESHLQSFLPVELVPCNYVPLLNLPLTSQGKVDEQALTRIEVIDSDLVARWEAQLQILPNIDEVAVVVQPQTNSLLPLHLSDLIPNWQTLIGKSDRQGRIKVEAKHNKSISNKPAISHGDTFFLDQNAPKTLVQTIRRAAQDSPTKGIVYIQADGSITQSYKDLLLQAQRILTGLKKLGLKPQDKVIFQLEQNQDFICAFWGCVLGGFIPVPIAIASAYSQDNSTTRKLENAWQMLKKPIVLTTAKLAQTIHSWSKVANLENFSLATVDELLFCEPDQNWHNSQPDDLALLLLTSGSTGIPKAVMQSHRALLSRSAATAQMNNFTSIDVLLNWFPLDHVGGLVMFHILGVYLGCEQVNAPIELVLQNPLLWLDWIENYQATVTWAPNFAYGLINERAEQLSKRCWDLSSMRFILNGGEAIIAKHARKFLQLLAPHQLSATVMHPSWGMSETSSGVVFSHFLLETTTDNDSFVEVGAPIPGVSLRIVDDLHQVVTENTIGRVQIKGYPVTSGYYQNPELNREVFTQDGWFNTGDLGFLNFGRLTITGRQKDVIIINGLNYYSHEIESIVEELAGVEVSFTAAVAVRGAFDHTDKLSIFFSLTVTDELEIVHLIKEIRHQVLQKIGVNPDYLIPVEKQTIPKTAIGKIQRQQLKTRFEAGEFNDILKQLDIKTGNANTVPDWFYRKIWHPKIAATYTSQVHSGCYLIFLDGLGLGKFICRELYRLKQPYISVEAGLEFAQLHHNHYCINPHQPDHYRQLLEALKANELRITQILHLWTYNNYDGEISNLEALENAQKQGIYSLLFLIQALAKIQGSEDLVQLQVISSNTQFTSSTDKIAYEKSTLVGFLKTVPLELSWLQCRHIDLEVESVEVNAAHILQELCVVGSDAEIAYRHGRRFCSSVAKVDLLQQKTQNIPFKVGGIYLVTGGLGGIGTYLCQFLIKEYGAKLIIVGRTKLPDRTEWSKHLDQETRLAKKIKNYQTIEAVGGEFIYQAVDICDLDNLQKVVTQAELNWNEPLSGIIHLAGEGNLEHHWQVMDEHWLTVETQKTFEAMLRPKVQGTWILYQLLKNNSQAVFISFSSVNSIFGGATFSAYSAANSFLDCCSLYYKYHSQPQTYCLNWGLWNDLGMTQGNPEYARDAARGMGYHIISKEQGLSSLLAALYRNQTHLIVGLDGSNRHMQRYTNSKFYAVQKLTAYFTAKNNNSSIVSLSELTVRDRFKTKTKIDFVQLQQIPRTDTGAIDREQLLNLASQGHTGANKWEAPRTETERQLVNIWQEVLSVPQVGIHDNFFELGGHSLLATQLISRVRDILQLDLPLRYLFEAPTPADLAELMETVRWGKQQLESLKSDEREEIEL